MAAHFLPLIVMTVVNPYSRLGAKEKHIRALHIFLRNVRSGVRLVRERRDALIQITT
jgi:hypothetical protein